MRRAGQMTVQCIVSPDEDSADGQEIRQTNNRPRARRQPRAIRSWRPINRPSRLLRLSAAAAATDGVPMEQFSAVVDILTTVTLISGLFFAAFEWRRSRVESRRQAQILLLRSFDSPAFANAMRQILDLPDDLSRSQIEAALSKDGMDLLWYYQGVMESLGFLVFNREIDIRIVDQTLGGPVILTWRRLRQYADDVRREMDRETMYEWYQWLAERLETLEREEGRTPAHVRENDWRP